MKNFPTREYQRRYEALRSKMHERGLDCVIVPGGPNHWSFGGGMLWLSGHWEWHAMANYVVFPLEGEPTLIYSMGGTHIEATRRESAIKDVRQSRGGRFAEVMIERIKELGLERGKIGILEVDPRFHDYLPVNQYNALREALPNASFSFESGLMHELVYKKSDEELQCIRKAGKLCENALRALADRCRPGVTEYQLKAAAAGAILEGGGDVDFAIIGSTPMRNPALIFGNPRPSGRVLSNGDIVIMELAAGYRGYSAQIGSPVCIGEPPKEIRRFFDDIVLPGFEKMVAVARRGPSSERAESKPRDFIGRKAFSLAPYTSTASTSSAPSRTSSPTTSKPKNTSKCSSPAWCS